MIVIGGNTHWLGKFGQERKFTSDAPLSRTSIDRTFICSRKMRIGFDGDWHVTYTHLHNIDNERLHCAFAFFLFLFKQCMHQCQRANGCINLIRWFLSLARALNRLVIVDGNTKEKSEEYMHCLTSRMSLHQCLFSPPSVSSICRTERRHQNNSTKANDEHTRCLCLWPIGREHMDIAHPNTNRKFLSYRHSRPTKREEEDRSLFINGRRSKIAREERERKYLADRHSIASSAFSLASDAILSGKEDDRKIWADRSISPMHWSSHQ